MDQIACDTTQVEAFTKKPPLSRVSAELIELEKTIPFSLTILSVG